MLHPHPDTSSNHHFLNPLYCLGMLHLHPDTSSNHRFLNPLYRLGMLHLHPDTSSNHHPYNLYTTPNHFHRLDTSSNRLSDMHLDINPNQPRNYLPLGVFPAGSQITIQHLYVVYSSA